MIAALTWLVHNHPTETQQVKTTIPTTLTLALVGGLGLAAPAAAQDLVAKKQAKLEKPFLKNAKWFTDYDKARAAAKKSKKVIFTYFTRTYAR